MWCKHIICVVFFISMDVTESNKEPVLHMLSVPAA